VKNIAYILLFCFAISFVQKTSGGKAFSSKYEKQSGQNESDGESEQETDESEDNNSEEKSKIESEDKYCESANFYLPYNKSDLLVRRNELYFHSQECFLKSPSLTIFAPPPNA
jgi:hypothetical protein